jgi:hypothetical protein
MNYSKDVKDEDIILSGDYVTYQDHKFVVDNVNYTPRQRKILIRKMKLNKIFGYEFK